MVTSTALDREAVDEAVARGSDFLKQGKLEDAQKAFRSALLIDEHNPRVLALLGLTYFKAGQFTQAQPIYEELVERAPSDASHRLNLGLVYLKLGESESAIGALEASRALDPSQGRAVSYLGLAYARAGRYAEAYRSFLLAGQRELASEIEVNLTQAERDSILAQLDHPNEVRKTAAPSTPPPAPTASAPSESSAGIGVVSMPAIVIDRPPQPDPTDHDDATDRAFSEVQAIPGSAAAAAPAARHDEPKPGEIRAPEMSESQQFVLPRAQAVPTPVAGQSMISRAVEVATPSSAARASGVAAGPSSTGPIPLSQLATEGLVRAGEGGEPFELTSTGALVIRVVERTITRLDGIHVSGGELEYEPAMRKSRGSLTNEAFDYGGSRMHVVSGKGYLIAAPAEGKKFTAVTLDDDIFYLREDLVFAFDAALRWENGNVPGLRGKLPVVQFRGDGAVALRTQAALVRVKLPAQGVVYVDASRLAGWIGRVIPRAVVPPEHGPMGEVCVECTGEGVVLVDPSGPLPAITAPRAQAPAPAEHPKATPPPPPQPHAASEGSGMIELDVVKNAEWLADDNADGESKPDDTI